MVYSDTLVMVDVAALSVDTFPVVLVMTRSVERVEPAIEMVEVLTAVVNTEVTTTVTV